MSNEMKLLLALCDALGFDVFTDASWEEQPESDSEVEKFHELSQHGINYKGRKLVSFSGGTGWVSQLVEPEVTFKLVRREE